MQWPLIENQVRAQYKLLNHDGYWTRVRNSNEKEEKYLFGVEEIVVWAKARSGKGNLYLSRNPFTKNGQVAGISGFTLDVDKVREPKDRATTEDELRGTLTLAAKINKDFGNSGTLATSGNGALLLFPFDETVHESLEQFTEQAKRFEKQIIEKFQIPGVRIDATNYAKAILRLMGTPNVKDQDPKRWRYARFISKPVFRAKRSRVLEAIKGISLSQSVSVPALVGETSQASGTGMAGPNVDSENDARRLGPTARLALAEASIQRLSVERVNNYDDWIKCGIALKEFGSAGLQIWRDWSRKSPKYRDGDCEAKWNTFGFQPSLTVGSLKYWADQDTGVQLGTTVRTLPGPVVREQPKLWTPGQPISSRRGEGQDSSNLGISTGFKWLDEKLNGGYRPGVVYAVEACTNVGKSAFVIQAAKNSCETGRRVLLVTTEASIEEVCQRYWACGTGIPTSEISNGSASNDRRQQLEQYQEQFRTSHKLGIWYTVSPKTEEIERQINEFRPEILLWDYFQHFETGTESRQIQLGSLARWFESVALAYQLPVVVAAQLHERFDFKVRKRLPSIKDDVKDCKTINDAAKVVMVLDWDSKAQAADTSPTLVRLSLEKNKGPMGETRILLNRQIPRFEEI